MTPTAVDILSTPLQFLKGVGPRKAADLKRAGLVLVQDLLYRLPIAALFLGFGLLNAFVDVARGFVHLARRGPMQGIGRMLVVAWAALPALADAVTSVRLAFRLRGEKFGPRALVPILEHTL